MQSSSVRNSGAGNGCAKKNAFFLQENTHVQKIPPVRGGGYFGFGGGGVPILFFRARGFF